MINLLSVFKAPDESGSYKITKITVMRNFLDVIIKTLDSGSESGITKENMRTEGKIQSTPRIYLLTAWPIMRSPFFMITFSFALFGLGIVLLNKKEVLEGFVHFMTVVLGSIPEIVTWVIVSDEFIAAFTVISVLLCFFTLFIEKSWAVLVIGIINIIISVFIYIVRLSHLAFIPLFLSAYPLLKYALLPGKYKKNMKIVLFRQIPFTLLIVIIFYMFAFYCLVPGGIFSGWTWTD